MGVFSSKADEQQRARLAAERATQDASRVRLAALRELEQDASDFLPKLVDFFSAEQRDAPKMGYLASVQSFSNDDPLAVGAFITFVNNPARPTDKEYLFRVTIAGDRRVKVSWNRQVNGGRYERLGDEDLGAITDPTVLSRVEQSLGKMVDSVQD